jgi:serine/threonine-protein kinase
MTHALPGRALLTDFGIARNVDDISGLTATNMTVGTVAYAAPEQLMGEELDGRADQYALAATAYHLLTGSHLFPHSNPAVVIGRHLNATPPALADNHPELSGLDSALAVALAKDPKDRFPRCSDFARALAEPASAHDSQSHSEATEPATRAAGEPPYSPAVRGSRRHWLAPVAALVAILLACAIALMWHPWRERQGTASPTTTPWSRQSVPTSTTVANSVTTPPPRAAPASTEHPPATVTITTVAVDASGQPTNGYREAYNDPNKTVTDCDLASSAAVSNNIYFCVPYAAGSDVCWPSPPTSMLCLVDHDPWDKALHRFHWDNRSLPAVAPYEKPSPFAVLLDDGTRCKYDYKALGAQDDGYYGFYSCGTLDALLAKESGHPIDRSQPLWTVKVGQVGSPNSHFAPPQAHTVVTAWFAGT